MPAKKRKPMQAHLFHIDLDQWPEVRTTRWCSQLARRVLQTFGCKTTAVHEDAVTHECWVSESLVDVTERVRQVALAFGLLSDDDDDNDGDSGVVRPEQYTTTRRHFHVGFVTVREDMLQRAKLTNTDPRALRMILRKVWPKYYAARGDDLAIDDRKNKRSVLASFTSMHFRLADAHYALIKASQHEAAIRQSGAAKIAAWNRMERQRAVAC